jgi:hypothetical protein
MVRMIALPPSTVNVTSLPGDPWWRIALDLVAGLGAIVPLVLFMVERKDRKAAQAEADELRAAGALKEERAQAQRFHLWAQDMEGTLSSTPYKVRMVNTGGVPIKNVSAEITITFDGTTEQFSFAIGFVLPTARGEIFDRDVSSQAEVLRALDSWARSGSTPARRPTVGTPEVRFTDPQGRRWHRTGDGVLTPVGGGDS